MECREMSLISYGIYIEINKNDNGGYIEMTHGTVESPPAPSFLLVGIFIDDYE